VIEYLVDIDKAMLVAVNGSYDLFQDALWWMVSSKWSSALIVLALLWILLHKNRRHALLVLAMLVLAIVVADQVSSGIIKGLVERLRPSHEPSLSSVIHIVNGYHGGLYGFVSSHAANSVAVCTLIALVMRHRAATLSLAAWAAMQCYSRVYLGVHYPGDILGGIVVGLLAGWLVWRLMRAIERRWHLSSPPYDRNDGLTMAAAVGVTIAALLTAALVI